MTAIQFVRSDAARVGPHANVLVQSALAALAAPSVFDSQPWRWRISDETADLRADRTRQLAAVDPDGRLLTVSCGAALHHARTALAAAGYGTEVAYLPDPDDADLLATIRLGRPVVADPQTQRLFRAMSLRATDRRPFADQPVPAQALIELCAAAEAHGAHLYLAERPTTHVVLFTDGNDRVDWLASGEALSAVLLAAAAHGLVATSPLSDLVAAPGSHLLLRDPPAGTGHPTMVIHVGLPSAGVPGPRCAEHPVDQPGAARIIR